MTEGRIYTGDQLRDGQIFDCDVCVVGSGAGGAVLAHQLVAKQFSVVMVEEGGHFNRRTFDMKESTAYPNLYQELGNRTTSDLSVNILQGRCVGGGTTVNWCSSFRTPRRILETWRDVHGVKGLSESELSPHWDALETALHVEEWPEEMMNRNNRILWEGCGKLGYQRGLIRRNVHRCANLGYCGMGCPIDAKQSMLVTFIPQAVEQGLTVLSNLSARWIETKGRKASAVHGEVFSPVTDRPTGQKVTVRAKVTVVSCGALNSPALLLRSDLTGQGQVGRRTFLHPTVVMAALFDEPVEAFSGAPQSAYSHQFIDRGPDRLGFFLEVPPIHPMLASTTLAGFGRLQQELLSKLPLLHASIALSVDGLLPEDQGGTVTLRSKGYDRLKFDYPLHPFHWEAFRTACEEMAKIQFAAGARKVISLHNDPVTLESISELHKLSAASWEKLGLRLVTAHQMGGCAMGNNPHTSVVNSNLKYHDLDNLFIVDGSVFPTSLGVNPQLTIYGLSRWASAHVASAVQG